MERIAQTNQPGKRGAKSALAIESIQMRFVIHMQPVSATETCLLNGRADKSAPNPPPLPFGMHGSVEQEDMHSTIPREVDKADQHAV